MLVQITRVLNHTPDAPLLDLSREDKRIITTYTDFQAFIREKQKKFPGARLTLTHPGSGLSLQIEHDCVVAVSSLPLAHNDEMELFIMWGRFALSTENHDTEISIEASMPSLRMPSKMEMFSLLFLFWFFGGAAAMKAFTAGLSLLMPYSEAGGIGYALFVTAITTYFYVDNLKAAYHNLFPDPRAHIMTLHTGNNGLYCQLAPPSQQYSRTLNSGRRFGFQLFAGAFHGAAQYAMVSAAWDALAQRGCIIPFGNPYLRYSLALTLILANMAVGFNQSTSIYYLLQSCLKGWFGQYSEAASAKAKIVVLAMDSLDKSMIKSQRYFNLASLRSHLLQRLLDLTGPSQGAPNLDALLTVIEFYTEYLELAVAVLSALNKARPYLESQYSFEAVKRLVVERIFKESEATTHAELVDARYRLIAKLEKWLEAFNKLLILSPPPGTSGGANGEANAAAADGKIPSSHAGPPELIEAEILEWCQLYSSPHTVIHINNEAHDSTPLLEAPVRRDIVRPPLRSVCIEVSVAGYWSTTFVRALNLTLAVTGVKPNIDGVAAILAEYLGVVPRYIISLLGAVGPIGLNYASLEKMRLHELPCMPKLVYRQGKQRSSMSKWLGRFLSLIASAVIYYNVTSYGITLPLSLSDIDSPLFWLKLMPVLISWWLIVDTKSAPLYGLMEEGLKKMGCIKTATVLDDRVLFHDYLVRKMEAQLAAIGELVGALRSLKPDLVTLSRIVGEFPTAEVTEHLLEDIARSAPVESANFSDPTSLNVPAILSPSLSPTGFFQETGSNARPDNDDLLRRAGYNLLNHQPVFNPDLFWRSLNSNINNRDGLKPNAEKVNAAYERILRFYQAAKLCRASVLQDQQRFNASFFTIPGEKKSVTEERRSVGNQALRLAYLSN